MSLWEHALAVVGLVVGCVGWWALQHLSGGERLESCTPGDGCGACTTRSTCAPVSTDPPHDPPSPRSIGPSVLELAEPFRVSPAGDLSPLKVLERAGLFTRKNCG